MSFKPSVLFCFFSSLSFFSSSLSRYSVLPSWRGGTRTRDCLTTSRLIGDVVSLTSDTSHYVLLFHTVLQHRMCRLGFDGYGGVCHFSLLKIDCTFPRNHSDDHPDTVTTFSVWVTSPPAITFNFFIYLLFCHLYMSSIHRLDHSLVKV